MAGDIKKDKTKAELENLGRLVDRYAQSRPLPILLVLPFMLFNAVLLLAAIELAPIYVPLFGGRGSLIVMTAVFLWVMFSSIYLPFRIVKRFGNCFYEKEGSIELQKEKIPIWTWIAYGITFIGPAFLNVFNIIPVRWALTISLTSFGVFIVYTGRRHKEAVLGFVYGLLCLTCAAATAAGVPAFFVGTHSYFTSLMIYIIGSGLITTVVVHIYNRRVLRKIKEMRPFSEQGKDTGS